ncbi:Cysteine protease atg4 [Physocladia obscura]|uniref:Cysteine protease n=1 Tax=Physocladia obscura TaxID=109957 RepID=A0AAD5T3A3_9FUNG|nr:Cysteine protease atg4 [Physocladia obscura]
MWFLSSISSVSLAWHRLINAASEGFRYYADPTYAAAGPVVFLGRSYASLRDPAFASDCRARLVGWGCMLRSGQMLLANCLIFHLLGRDWTLADNSGENWDNYVKIISYFLDSNSSPYSIHRIALIGTQYDKNIGEWFGPTTISQVLKVLHENQQSNTNLVIHVVSDGVLLLDELNALCIRKDDDGKSSWSSVLILIPVRLGLDSLNSVYYESIKKCLKMPFSVGIAGGRPNSSLYFMGVEGAIDLKDPASYTAEDLESYHCPNIRIVPISTLDPSMVLGFYCRDSREVDAFVRETKKTLCHGSTPLFSIQETAPNYQDADVLSDTDEF